MSHEENEIEYTIIFEENNGIGVHLSHQTVLPEDVVIFGRELLQLKSILTLKSKDSGKHQQNNGKYWSYQRNADF